MPIAGLSEQRRLPRLGKIRLGIKKKNKNGVEYPAATPYFVCPPGVQEVHGEKPKSLDVIIPVEDEEIWANQYYRQYSKSRGLICKGDGETCRRMVDMETGDIAGKDTKAVIWKHGMECPGRECPDYTGGACQEVMNLQFLPEYLRHCDACMVAEYREKGVAPGPGGIHLMAQDGEIDGK